MENIEIIECRIRGKAFASTNTIHIEVCELNNKQISILGLCISNFRLSVFGSFKKISECNYEKQSNSYIIKPKVKIKKNEWVVISLFDEIELSTIIRINNNYYKGCSSSIIIE